MHKLAIVPISHGQCIMNIISYLFLNIIIYRIVFLERFCVVLLCYVVCMTLLASSFLLHLSLTCACVLYMLCTYMYMLVEHYV